MHAALQEQQHHQLVQINQSVIVFRLLTIRQLQMNPLKYLLNDDSIDTYLCTLS